MSTGLLATNKQFHQETRSIYWSTNNFHLPRGDYRNSEAFLQNISPEHIGLLKTINIDLSLADLTPQLLQYLERKAYGDQDGRLPRNHFSSYWGLVASSLLREIWEEKIRWVQKCFNHVSDIFITCFEDPVTDFLFPGNKLKDEIAGFCEQRAHNTCTGLILQFATGCARVRVQDRVQRIGWDNFKEELAAGGWGRRKNDQWCSDPSKIRY